MQNFCEFFRKIFQLLHCTIVFVIVSSPKTALMQLSNRSYSELVFLFHSIRHNVRHL